MRILKNADYDYERYNVNQQSGWNVWYNWEKVKKHTKFINIILAIILLISSFLFKDFYGKNGITSLFFSLGSALLTWIFIITPIHEILHLLPCCKFKLNQYCVISLQKSSVSAIYNNITKRSVKCFSYLFPVISLSIIIGVLIGFLYSSNIIVYLILLLIFNIYGSYTDIYMFFYTIKNLKKDDLIFGIFYKTI